MRALCADALTAALAAQTPSSPEISVVTDAVAADSQGHVVADLKPSDFEVLENGRPLQVESVRLVKSDGQATGGEAIRSILSRADEEAEARQEGTRLFAIFLDEYHTAAGTDSARIRETAQHFLDALGPRDMFVVVRPLDSLLNLRLTRDREAGRRAIEGFEGRKDDLEPRTPFEKNFIGGDPARVVSVRSQIVLSALNA